MPLIKCPDCGQEMSDAAKTVCTKCGYRNNFDSTDKLVVFLLVGGGVAVLFTLLYVFNAG